MKPNKSIVLFVCSLFFLSVLLIPLQTVYMQGREPLTLAMIFTALQSSASGLRVEQKNEFLLKRVKERGVNFDLTPQIESSLKDLGASPELIEAIRLNSINSKSVTTQSTVTRSNNAPLTYPQIITALNAKVPNKVYRNKTEVINYLIQAIKVRKIDAPLTKDIENLLLQSGASQILIKTIKENSVSSSGNKEVAFYNEQGDRFWEARDYDEAIGSFTKALELEPDNFYSLVSRGFMYYIKNEFDKSLKDYTKAITINSENAFAYYFRGLTYGKAGETIKALADFDRSIRLDPEFASTFFERGKIYHKNGNFDKALADFTRAVELEPENDLAFEQRAFTYAALQEMDKTVEDFTEAIRLNPKMAYHYNNRGTAYSRSGRFDEALRDFNRSIELNPNNADAYNNRGVLFDRTKNFDRAAADYRKALEIDPDHPYAGKNLELLLAKDGN